MQASANLVWGFESQALISGHSLFLLIQVSLFDLEARFFAPTHNCRVLSRAGAVKVGRRANVAAHFQHGQAMP
jgi:hypothetical protein